MEECVLVEIEELAVESAIQEIHCRERFAIVDHDCVGTSGMCSLNGKGSKNAD
jgi:hypothetical protein